MGSFLLLILKKKKRKERIQFALINTQFPFRVISKPQIPFVFKTVLLPQLGLLQALGPEQGAGGEGWPGWHSEGMPWHPPAGADSRDWFPNVAPLFAGLRSVSKVREHTSKSWSVFTHLKFQGRHPPPLQLGEWEGKRIIAIICTIVSKATFLPIFLRVNSSIPSGWVMG